MLQGNRVLLLQRKVSIAAKAIQSLAYCCDNEDDLTQLLGKLECIAGEVKKSLPNSEGLVIRPSLSSARVRRIKLKYKNLVKRTRQYGSLVHLQKQPGRKRQDYRFRNRVGQRADRLRQVYIHTFITYTAYPPSIEIVLGYGLLRYTVCSLLFRRIPVVKDQGSVRSQWLQCQVNKEFSFHSIFVMTITGWIIVRSEAKKMSSM